MSEKKIVEPVGKMSDEAILSNDKQFTSFMFNGHNIFDVDEFLAPIKKVRIKYE